MFDNVAFEVVIGLVFVYLLYSLLVTILSELIATWLNIRGNMLRVAIERMLNDGYYYKLETEKKRFQKYGLFFKSIFNKKINNNIRWRRGAELKERPEFKHSFAGRFYNYPAIKYLGRLEKVKEGKLTLSKPAYISAAYFAESIVNFLADKGSGKTVMDKVSFCLRFNTFGIQPNTLRQFKNLFEASVNINAFKANLVNWYNETMDRTTGWYKQKIKLITFLLGVCIAVVFNVDTIKIAKILANDKEARSQLVNMGITMAKDSARYKDFVLNNGDTVHSQAVLDSGFAKVNDDINKANLVLGVGWDFSKELKKDSVKINASNPANIFIGLLGGIDKANKTIRDSLEKNQRNLPAHKSQLDNLLRKVAVDSIQLQIENSYNNSKSHIDSFNKQVSDDTLALLRAKLNYNIILAKIKIDSASLNANQQLKTFLYGKINSTAGNNLIAITSIGKPDSLHNTTIFGERKLSGTEKIKKVLATIFWYSIIGFLITALALSLGAPFWFDMLNKLVAIRTAGVKPEEKKEEPLTKTDIIANKEQPGVTDLTPQKPDPIPDIIEAAYQQYADALKKIPGVKSVFTVTKKGIKQLQVNVDNTVTKTELNNQFPNGLKTGNITVPLNIVESGVPAAHIGDGLISNSSGLNGFGSLGCIVEWKEAGTQHILSCWHVLKGDLSYSNTDSSRIIKEKNGDEILAERWAGGLRAQYDYGLARCRDKIEYSDNKLLRRVFEIGNATINFHSVSKNDVANQIQVKYYNALSQTIITGIIYSDSEAVEIDYPDKTRLVEDVILLTNENEESISKGGNSGSIVFDMQNNAIAMIVGGDKNYTYAVKLSYVFKLHNEMTIA